LKRNILQVSVVRLKLSALDPGKQGLKLRRGAGNTSAILLSALDPGKQGLKHFRKHLRAEISEDFQRLIQENKD